MTQSIVLMLIGLVTALVALHGVARGNIYCKGGPYSRAKQPVAFWFSVAVYLSWTAMMVYFAFARRW